MFLGHCACDIVNSPSAFVFPVELNGRLCLAASLDNTTRYPLEYTVFAPTDEAFAAALASLDTTLAELDQEGLLDDILQYHFIIQPYTVSTLLMPCCTVDFL